MDSATSEDGEASVIRLKSRAAAPVPNPANWVTTNRTPLAVPTQVHSGVLRVMRTSKLFETILYGSLRVNGTPTQDPAVPGLPAVRPPTRACDPAAAATWGSDLCTALHWALNQNGSRVSTLVRCAGITKAAMRDALKASANWSQGTSQEHASNLGWPLARTPVSSQPRRGGHAHIRVLWSRGSESEAGGERHNR